MSERVTQKELETTAKRFAEFMPAPEGIGYNEHKGEPITGEWQLDGAYGGWRMVACFPQDGHWIECSFGDGFLTKRELVHQLRAAMSGYELARGRNKGLNV